MLVALAQLNPTVGDVDGNLSLVLDAVEASRAQGADLVVCPEQMLIGYPARDLLYREGVVEASEHAVAQVAAAAGNMTVIVGHPRMAPGGLRGVRNAASICRDGDVLAVYDKRLLPGYDVFDEDRYFDPGDHVVTVETTGGRIGVMICEDMYQADDVHASPDYGHDPLADLKAEGCDLVVSLNASPFIVGKHARHLQRVREVVSVLGVPLIVVNQVGSNDDLVFDGRSMVVGSNGDLVAELPAWRTCLEVVDLDRGALQPVPVPADPPEDMFHALVTGVHDYCRKTGHDTVVLGLSGGIDSALTAVIAERALGAEQVHGMLMPSRYSSPGSITDARELVRRIGLIRCEEIEIQSTHEAVRAALQPTLGDGLDGVTDENIQARLRGLYLMAHANATGSLVLATGNKSELAAGYSTLYGDMCGALQVLGDVRKQQVYEIARGINEHANVLGYDGPPIPEESINKPPSAELRPGQFDEDSLGSYDRLDQFLEGWIDGELSVETIASGMGLRVEEVQDLARMVDGAEYKRAQAGAILKVSPRAFGPGRAMPIVKR